MVMLVMDIYGNADSTFHAGPFCLGYVSITPFSSVSVFISLRFRMILNRFHYSVFSKSAWYENGGVSITPFSFVFISFVRTRFETEDVV